MKRIAACALALSLLLSPPVQGSELMLEVGSLAGPAWRAEGLRLSVAPQSSELQLDIARIAIAGRPPLRDFRLRCAALVAAPVTACEQARFSVTVPGWGRLQGRLTARFHNAQRWQAQLELPQRGLRLQLRQAGNATQVALSLRGQPAGALQQLASAFKLVLPGELSGGLDLSLDASLADRLHAELRLSARQLGYSEPSGRYASEQLSADAVLRYDEAGGDWELQFDSRGGQAYVEPLFLDFAALPLQAEGRFQARAGGWNIERLRLLQGQAGSVELSGALGADFKPLQLDARLDARDLAPLLTTYVQPLLIGSRLDGLSGSGRASARLSLRDGAVQALSAQLDGVGLKADKLGLALEQLSGDLAWATAGAGASTLRWQGGAIQRVPLGPSDISFRAQGRGFQLLAPWRQPLLEGALRVEKLELRELGSPQLSADFEGAVEPINLAALCKALDWPAFGGTLSGRLPGLSVREDVWSVDGALEAQAFGGRLRLQRLRAIQPFGVLPRVMADVEIRGLDLKQLTGAFSFGRITGRLDGEVQGLRLLNWSPVAFDAKLYSTPGDRSKRRISQRAIDNISAIGGGPTGMLSRGFLSVFDDFAYSRLGIRCVLRDGVCQMDGVAPAPSKNGLKAYYLVQGRLLPRIDVVGYAPRVSWTQLVEQLKAAKSSGGPQLE
ncbi:MAG: hypothetical protein Q8Q73_05720 [Stagnimonas sp.]|nr:hypothetical protein [Stagnimonas sp.]